jgi:hypothetical protein
MKAVLKFDLDNPDDVISHKRCVKALDMACILFEIQHNLKKKLTHKFESQPTSYMVLDGVDETFEHINNLFEEYNINLEEIIE